ncbi:hypothetical protein [Pontibacter cellulosilyticus]|uniref:Uncharacterized protein n=1 Tax=Pontibacter cellulosilyticus TaxID=1720253 RepID=A0A923N3J9_9BACT|nr:hypothetical protein [Pontibacter cellulosilyticus]MBC5992250.1 hypothetical protein [Pontibacter cellulosilyticus]
MHLKLYKLISFIRPAYTLPLLLVILIGCATKNFYAETQVADPAVYQQLLQDPTSVDSVTVKAGKHYQRGQFYRLLWGTRHRNAWTAPVIVPILRLDTVKGGLKVERIGGGMQTISATMVGADGMVYALRTVDKRPQVMLPPILQNTIFADLVRDQTSALNPYGALVVAPLARAVGVHTSTPTLVYITPNEDRLKEHKKLLSDRLYLLEEKFNDKRSLVGELSEAYDILNTDEVLANRYKYNNHVIDQLEFAKARLLDLLIGDRDRHEEQWEWAVFKENGQHIYRPLPKDRDNAFFRYDDGILSWLISRKWTNRKFETFDKKYKDVKALMIKSEFIDARAMPDVTAYQFDSLANDMKQRLTDQVIAQAVQKLPDSVYELQGETLEQNLRSRRDNLDKAARKFYEVLSEKVLVIGTDQPDVFKVNRLNDNETEVTVSRLSDGTKIYHRIFNRAETDAITLHDLGGDDTIEVTGTVGKGIQISLMEGPGKNKVINTSSVGGWGKKFEVQQSKMKKDKAGKGSGKKDKQPVQATVR